MVLLTLGTDYLHVSLRRFNTWNFIVILIFFLILSFLNHRNMIRTCLPRRSIFIFISFQFFYTSEIPCLFVHTYYWFQFFQVELMASLSDFLFTFILFSLYSHISLLHILFQDNSLPICWFLWTSIFSLQSLAITSRSKCKICQTIFMIVAIITIWYQNDIISKKYLVHIDVGWIFFFMHYLSLK